MANNCLKRKIEYGQKSMHRCKIPPTKSKYLPFTVFPPSCVSSFYNGRTANPDSLPWSTLGDIGVTLNYFNCRKSLGESTQQNFSVLSERLEVGGTEIDGDLKLMISW